MEPLLEQENAIIQRVERICSVLVPIEVQTRNLEPAQEGGNPDIRFQP